MKKETIIHPNAQSNNVKKTNPNEKLFILTDPSVPGEGQTYLTKPRQNTFQECRDPFPVPYMSFHKSNGDPLFRTIFTDFHKVLVCA